MNVDADASSGGAGLLNAATGKEMFVHRFISTARTHAHRPCVIEAGDHVYTYRDMLERSWAIGLELRKRGVQQEKVIGICVEKSFDYIASLLGVWLAGAAFMPLDASLPPERLRQMIEESGSRLVIVQPSAAHLFHDLGVDALTLGSETEMAPGVQLACVSPGDLAYVIFTSGSTGKSKGVLVEHRGIVNFIDAQIEAFRLKSESRVLFYLSAAFDASVSDIGTALLSGAAICIEPALSSLSASELASLIRRREITHMDIPPSLLRVLECDSMPQSLATIIIGGEACAPDIVRRWAARFRLVNVYGPTESTVCTSLCVCDPQTWNHPLIGTPIAGVTYHILDEQARKVAQGMAGELYIGGIALARGYVGRPELTRQKFVHLDGERLYRTGDLVCADAAGNIEFLGRTDRQVKVRGLLVAPEEIEARLLEHAAVERAAVLTRAWSTGGGREVLVAFVVGRSGVDKPNARALRDHLAGSLPRWMLPQHYELVEAMPLTVTGKVDLSALKLSPLSRKVQDDAVGNIESGATTRAVLRRIFCEVLALEEIGDDDDFFDLGGDSFAVIEVAAAAESRGVSVPPALLVQHSKIARLAAAIEDLRADSADQESAITAAGGMSCRELRADVEKAVALFLGGGATVSGGQCSNTKTEDSRAATAERCHVHSNAKAQASHAGTVSGTSGANAAQPAWIFLTGATGFLGSRLLSELLQRTNAHIYCLVRSASPEAARERVLRALSGHGTSANLLNHERIIPLCGSIEDPFFAIPQEEWNVLASKIDTIYHCAAQVNMVLPYAKLRPANLQGTLEVARLMRAGPEKHLHYASTLSVFVATDRNTGVALESDVLGDTGWVYGGYAQTKWASEVLLRQLQPALGAVSFYRFGLITGDTITGCSAPNDFLSLFVRGIAAIGCVPPIDASLAIDITPVDYSAAAMAQLSLRQGGGTTYHIANPVSLRLADLLRNLRQTGIDLPEVAPDEFLARLTDAGTAQAAAYLALCRSLSGPSSFERLRSLDLFQATGIKFDTSNTQRDLCGSGLSCPLPADDLIRLYLSARAE